MVPAGIPSSLADRSVALVAAEEAVENLLTLLAELREAGPNLHRLVEPRDHVIGGSLLRLLDEH